MIICPQNRKSRILIKMFIIGCRGAARGSCILDGAVITRTFFAAAAFFLCTCFANSVTHVRQLNTAVSQILDVPLSNFCDGIYKSIDVVERTVGPSGLQFAPVTPYLDLFARISRPRRMTRESRVPAGAGTSSIL
jgi:hypothetical protein